MTANELDPKDQQAVLDAAMRVGNFLKDEAVQSAIQALKESNYRLFLDAPNEEGRAMAQAQAQVLRGFEAALLGIVGAGERASIEQERRDRAPAAPQNTGF